MKCTQCNFYISEFQFLLFYVSKLVETDPPGVMLIVDGYSHIMRHLISNGMLSLKDRSTDKFPVLTVGTRSASNALRLKKERNY